MIFRANKLLDGSEGAATITLYPTTRSLSRESRPLRKDVEQAIESMSKGIVL